MQLPTIRSSAGIGSRACGRTRRSSSKCMNRCATAGRAGRRTPPLPTRTCRPMRGHAKASRSARSHFFEAGAALPLFREGGNMLTTVYFATNRALEGPATDWTSYGTNIVAPSDPTAITYATAFIDNTDLTADKTGAIQTIENVSTGRFSQSAMDDLSNPGRNLLVFIHGFDNSFEAGITRAAFNREWFAASGVAAANTTVVAFSWPSLGRLLDLPLPWGDYQHDQIMAGQSGFHLMTFFANLQPLLTRARANGSRVFLLSHSMGNYALQAGVQSWFTHGNGDAALFDEAILAAADERYDSFDFPEPGQLSTLYRLA